MVAMATYSVRRSSDWGGEWTPAGETLDEAERTMLELGEPGEAVFYVTLHNAFNGSGAQYEVAPMFGRVAFLRPMAVEAPLFTESGKPVAFPGGSVR